MESGNVRHEGLLSLRSQSMCNLLILEADILRHSTKDAFGFSFQWLFIYWTVGRTF